MLTSRRSLAGMFALLLVSAMSCSDSTTDSTTSAGINLTGKWIGTAGASNDPHPTPIVWTASQSGTTVTGTLTADVETDAGKIVTVAGKMTGGVVGSTVMLVVSFPAGAFVAAGSPQSCAMSGTSTATLTGDNKINGNLAVLFVASCVGTVADRTDDVFQLKLTKS